MIKRWAVLAAAGIIIGAAGIAAPVMGHGLARATGAELIFLATAAVAAGLWLSIVTVSRSGSTVVINPAVCFTFALMLSWGVLPAVGAHLASVAMLGWRWRLTFTQGLIVTAQFIAAYAAAFGVLRLDGARGPRGQEWTSFHDAGIVVAATAAWLVVYTAVPYVFASVRRSGGNTRRALPRTAFLFNGALVVLSPGVAITAQANVALAVLFLLPLYATQRMARLSVEQERVDRVDPLTTLANRIALQETFDRRVRADAKAKLLVLLLNVDRFKYINESLGYDVGDQLLNCIGVRLKGLDHGEHLVGRLGADEFVILAGIPDAPAGETLAARAVEVVREPIELGGLLVEVTASVGAAIPSGELEDFVTVLRHADAAMYKAKRHGNAAAMYHGEGGDGSAEGLQLLADFREALSRVDSDEIALHYQPQMNLATGQIEGVEALLRWTHPIHGPVKAMTILALAEQTHIIHELTARVIDTVIPQAAAWRRQGLDLRVSVNISVRDLYRPSLVTQVAEALSRHDLPSHRIQFEITESALTTDPMQARATLHEIDKLGAGISLDDFGTGFSSLQQLKGTPLTEIKIDQSFVKGMVRNRDDAAIVASTINLAHALGLRVVAEGVEDQTTLARLNDLGCELAQGWLVSHALPADRVPSWFSSKS